MTNLEEVLAALDPKLRKRIAVAADAPDVQYCKTPSVGLNSALSGGLVYGRQVLLWGTKSSAKSSMCLQMVANAQQEGRVCAWIDAEMSYDESWAEKLGVDNSKLLYSTARTINDMVDVGVGFMKAGVDMIIVDSVSSLLPAIYFEKDSHDLKDLDQTKQIGAEARDMANAVKMLNYANNQAKPTLLVLISQVRNNIGGLYASQQPTGGLATKFYSSTIIKLFSSESEAQAIKGTVAVGDRLIEEKIGRKVRWELQFSKTSPNFQTGEYDFYFRGDEIGIDVVGELVDIADAMGYIEGKSPWYILPDGSKIQGRSNYIKRVKSDPELHKYLLEKVNGGRA